MAAERIVVDTNILFSILLRRESSQANTMLGQGYEFYVCESVFIELFKHKEKIVRLSHLTEDEVLRLLHSLLRRVRMYKEDLITPESLRKAYDLCSGVDEDDTPHVALAIELGALLWTGDKRLRQGLQAKGFDQFFPPTA